MARQTASHAHEEGAAATAGTQTETGTAAAGAAADATSKPSTARSKSVPARSRSAVKSAVKSASKSAAAKSGSAKSAAAKSGSARAAKAKPASAKPASAKPASAKPASADPAPAVSNAAPAASAQKKPPARSKRPRKAPVTGPVTIGRSGFTKLKNISEIRHYLRTSDTPVFFVGATAFNLLGLDRWVRGFSYISYYDSWDGMHPRVFTPAERPYVEFDSGEEINNWLLRNHEVRAHIERRTPPGVRPQVVMVFFDEETERICEELDYELILPSHELRERLDSKIVTTQIADSVGVPSVPNALTTVADWDELVRVADAAGLGQDLVIQTAYGDSGKTTYFVTSEAEFAAVADEVTGVEIKVMKRINNRPIAIEAVQTRHGTVVGPCMTEITGHADLTPYRGGWAGNEMFPTVLDDESRHAAVQLVRKLGDRLGKEGYRGFFEVDVLLDTDTGDVYLGELNPRVSGASAITNVTAGAYADVPLFAFHLLEYSGIDFEIDVDEINRRWEELASEDEWSHMVIKHTTDSVERIDSAPRTGRYVLDHYGNLVYSHGDLDWHLLTSESEAFYLRIYKEGDYRWKGADLGILVTKAHLEASHGGLTLHAKYLIDAIRGMYEVTTLEGDEPAPKPAPAKGK
ncbi:ATP-grasp domain-containing protein [Leucobacter triazinivorans]|uniref:ATP-grasp domain-containing protein n=1 Tax=Leucobacter triazinivorans TaxID=1784719 RepID=A0A4P6KDB2_9MICO|nr:ATP-grasp domain-containing protein [Leucobacter triazinivorans]